MEATHEIIDEMLAHSLLRRVMMIRFSLTRLATVSRIGGFRAHGTGDDDDGPSIIDDDAGPPGDPA